jgi:carbonic anhydrase
MIDQIKGTIDEFIGKLPVDRTLAKSKDKVDWMLVTCIDYRYSHFIHEYMKTTYPGELYDQMVLAGACLAAADSFTNRDYWRKTFLEHIGLSIDLHSISGVLILDHRTCGAYGPDGFKLLPATPTKDEELQKHFEVATETTKLVADVFVAKKKAARIQSSLLPTIAAGAGSSPDVVEPLVTVEV